MLFAEEPIQFQLPFVGGATLTLDEMHELVSLIQSEHSANSNSLIQSKRSANSSSGSDTNRSVYSVEEQKLRRMISNQKSARQSRLRKKMHLENLTNQVNRLRIENHPGYSDVGEARHGRVRALSDQQTGDRHS
ncbi:hypothetical protein F0562_027904 [Nyssa sinensis]|uniref:BZIP domain-containing protein n=1 Tax=Nyssa sinensis TaxID=561372 RepID=A0A5J5B4Z5_9ASTE|nr:hypothetical protein F0562_027904 [Nyssa sinensis]